MVCSGTHENFQKKRKKKKKDTIRVQVHVFLLVFYCLAPACLAMYNCEQLCQDQRSGQIQRSWSGSLIPSLAEEEEEDAEEGEEGLFMLGNMPTHVCV